jgi:hypothetical protein
MKKKLIKKKEHWVFIKVKGLSAATKSLIIVISYWNLDGAWACVYLYVGAL